MAGRSAMEGGASSVSALCCSRLELRRARASDSLHRDPSSTCLVSSFETKDEAKEAKFVDYVYSILATDMHSRAMLVYHHDR